ncbi:MAG: T9SS type A sorting domain-containing protein [Muribaculaceae bacterium]
MKRSILILFMALMVGCMQAKDLKIALTSGTERGITDVSKLTFADGKVIATLTDGSTEDVAIANIINIVFGIVDPSGINAVTADEAGISIYPTQATTHISVNGINAPAQVRIFSIGGNEVISTTVANGAKIDVSNLAPAVYVICIDNAVTKFVKL